MSGSCCPLTWTCHEECSSPGRGLLGFLLKLKAEIPVWKVARDPLHRASQPLPCSNFDWLLEGGWPLECGLAMAPGEGRSGAPEGEGELSVRSEWEGQEGTGGSEIWQARPLLVKTTLNPRCWDSGRLCSLSGLEKGRLSQSLGRFPVARWARHMCSRDTSEHSSL